MIIFILIILLVSHKKDVDIPQNPLPANEQTIADSEEDKLVQMLPQDYDKEGFRESWTNFLTAIQNERVDRGTLNDFFATLRDDVSNGKLDKDEADNLVRTMNNVSR